MSTSIPITKLVYKNLRRVHWVALFAIIALGLACFWLYAKKSSLAAQAEALAIVEQYAPNLESIFVLEERAALEVALERMSIQRKWLTYAQQPFRKSLGTTAMEFAIGPVDQRFGTIYAQIDLLAAMDWQIVALVALFLVAIWLGVSLIFRRVLLELQSSVSSPLKAFSDGLECTEGFRVPTTLASDQSRVREIEILRSSMLELFSRIESDAKQLERTKTSEAIARTTQNLAHDVRKPFSMLKLVLGAISDADDPSEAKEIAKASLPEVNQAMASVEGMIQDVMQIGSNSEPNQEVASCEAMIDAAVNELFRIFPEANVGIEYSLDHQHCLFIDTIRVGRVFSNILVNAVQAMNGKGTLWIKTHEENGFVEVRLGNLGSFIPKDSLPKLFDAFFTSGKKGGTGLGLAIAQKVVNEHGGSIRCESDQTERYPAGYVEFILTLPVASELSPKRKEPLPNHSRVIHEQLLKLKKKDSDSGGTDDLEQERIITKRLKTLSGAIPSVLIVDDEAVYRNSLAGLLTNFRGGESAVAKIPIVFAKNASEAMQMVKEHSPLLIIQDIDLGVGSKNGLDVIKDLRQEGYKGRICVHSNRFLFDDQKTAVEAGADSVLPKPMSRAHFFKLISSSLPAGTSSAPKVSQEKPTQTFKPRIAYIDDAITFTLSWKRKLKDNFEVETFSSTTKFFKKTADERDFLQSLDVIVTDYYFGEDDPLNGKTFAEELRKMGYEKPIYLASNGDFEAEDFKQVLTGVIGKEIPECETVMSWLGRA